MNRELVELREVITKLVPLLTGQGLKVTQRGSQAFVAVNPRTKKPEFVNIPSVPDNATPDFVRAIQGFIDHEVAHVLITNWDYYLVKDADHNPKAKRLQNLVNQVEDTMIEREIVKIFPGSHKNIADLRSHYIEKITKPVLEQFRREIKAGKRTEQDMFVSMLIVVLRALAGHEEMQRFMDEEKLWGQKYIKEFVDRLSPATKKALPYLTTTKETRAIAEEIERILYPNQPPPVVRAVNPTEGLPKGGYEVTIYGENFVDMMGAMFGDKPCAKYKHVSPKQIIVIAPKGEEGETVDVTVTTAYGSSTLPGAFRYVTPPPPPPSPEKDESDDGGEGEGSSGETGEKSKDKPEKKAGKGEGTGERDHSESEPGDDDGEPEKDAGKSKSGKDKDDAGEEEDDAETAAGEGEDEADDAGDGEEGAGGDAEDEEEDADDGAGDEDEGAGDSDDEGDDGEGAGDKEDASDEEGSDPDEDEAEDGKGAGDDGSEDDADEDEGDDPESDGDDGDGAGGSDPDEDDDDEGEADAGGSEAGGEEGGEAADDAKSSATGHSVSIDDGEGHSEPGVPEGDEEDDSDYDGGAMGGAPASTSIFNIGDDELDDADLSAQVSILISKEAVKELNAADYTVYTRDLDRIEPLKVPDGVVNKNWVPELEEQTRQMTSKMQKDIERMLASQSLVRNMAGFRSGRLHSPNLHRLQSGDDRIFARREEQVSKDTAVTLLVDNSGSMHGEKCLTAMVGAYALSSTLERVRIAHEVLGFTTCEFGHVPRTISEGIAKELREKKVRFSRSEPIVMPIYKGFDERINSEIKKRFVYTARAQIGLANNIDGESLEYAAQRLAKRREKRKVIMVLSDGHPAAAGMANYGGHLKLVVEKLTKAGFELIGIGIQDKAVERFYPKHVVLHKVEDLPGTIMKELRAILK